MTALWAAVGLAGVFAGGLWMVVVALRMMRKLVGG